MSDVTNENDNKLRRLWILGMVNVGIWAISIIALVFVIQRCPGAKGLFPILAGGMTVAIVLFSTLLKYKK